MIQRVKGIVVSTARALLRGGRWLRRRPSWMLMTADEPRLAQEPPKRFARSWWGLMGLSVLWGVVLVNVWGASWSVFRDYDPLIMPAAATSALFVLWAFRRPLAALAGVLGGRDAASRAVAAAGLVLVVGLCLARLSADTQRFEQPVPWWLQWLRPPTKLYRVLLLMPVWGAWSMIVTVQFCRPGERTGPQVAAFARGCGAPAAAVCMALPLVASLLSFRYLGQGSLALVSGAPIAAAIGSGLALCRHVGGLTRRALLAANVTTQIVFLGSYLAGR